MKKPKSLNKKLLSEIRKKFKKEHRLDKKIDFFIRMNLQQKIDSVFDLFSSFGLGSFGANFVKHIPNNNPAWPHWLKRQIKIDMLKNWQDSIEALKNNIILKSKKKASK